MKVEPFGSARPAFAAAVGNGVIRLSGRLVFATAADAFARLLGELSRGGSLAVDLSGLAVSDSAGLAVLIEWRAEAARQGVHLRMFGAGSDLRALARLADLDAELFE